MVRLERWMKMQALQKPSCRDSPALRITLHTSGSHEIIVTDASVLFLMGNMAAVFYCYIELTENL